MAKKNSKLKNVRSETKKIQWPTRKQAWQYTGIVLIIAAIVALLCWLLDLGFGALIGKFI